MKNSISSKAWMVFSLALLFFACNPSNNQEDVQETVSVKDNTTNSYNENNLPKAFFRKGIDTLLLIKGDTFLLKDVSIQYPHLSHLVFLDTSEKEHDEKEKYFHQYLTQPHPNIGTLKKYFKQAANEFEVPQPILEAIGQVENNWTQMGPTVDQGWGIMHLVENNYANTLTEAAQLLNIDKQLIKDDAQQNIRAAAALLAKYAGPQRKNFTSYEQWYSAMKQYSALINEQVQNLQLEEYTRVLYKGNQSTTLWGETLMLKPHSKTYK